MSFFFCGDQHLHNFLGDSDVQANKFIFLFTFSVMMKGVCLLKESMQMVGPDGVLMTLVMVKRTKI